MQLQEFRKAHRCLSRSLECVTPPYDSEASELADHMTDARAYSLMAQVELKCQNWEQAIERYRQAIATREGYPLDAVDACDNIRDRSFLGLVTVRAGRVAEGIEQVRDITADSPGAALIKAKAMMDVADVLESNPSLAKIAKSSPDDLRREVVRYVREAWQAGHQEARDWALGEPAAALRDLPEYQGLLVQMGDSH
jgi:hypothetical protein